MQNFEQYRVTVPPATSGQFKVEQFEVTEHGRTMWILNANGPEDMRRAPAVGTYTRLVRQVGYFGTTVMSDTDAEIMDHMPFIEWMQRPLCNTVRIHGLGIGMVLQAAIRSRHVRTIVVAEKEGDVIKLVGRHYEAMALKAGKTLVIYQTDVLEEMPTMRPLYDAVWHDIWDRYDDKEHEQSKMLHRRWQRYAGWQGSWGRDVYLRRRRRDQRAERSQLYGIRRPI